jgi:Asp-tRNA(Asn)/Glu-tRNA(Gln) amidotransferase A subunit family amidase
MVTHVLTEELALAQAARADRELAAGKLRSPLHGIPYGIENILATRGIRAPKTTAANDGQIPPGDVTVVRKLEESGAVLVAWLTPGKAVQAVADGAVPFAITSDGWGLPDSLLARGRVAALLPPKGVVSRAGCTALGWSTGRIGPVCRSAEECAIVLRAIAGPDGIDPSLPRDPPHLPTRTVPKPDAE